MSQASPRMQAMTKEYVGLRSAIPDKSKKPPAYMGWRTYAYNPCLTRVSFTDGMCVRQPSSMCPQINGREPMMMSNTASICAHRAGLNNKGVGASHASTKPVNQRGMPVKFLRTIVAICPPFSPHQREKTAVNALAPTSVNPVIMKNITAPIPAVPRYKTDRDATVKAIKR